MYDSRTDAAKRTHSEKGAGDWVEWDTPVSRQQATKRAEREAIVEGFAEYLDLLDDVAKAAYLSIPECS